MGESRVAYNFGMVFFSTLAAFMFLEYTYYQFPEAFLDQPLVPGLINVAGNWGAEIRLIYLFYSLMIFALSPYSEVVSDQFNKNPKTKIIFGVLFILSCLGLYYILYTGGLFGLLYPIFIVLHISTGFVISNLFKAPKQTIESDFEWKRNMELKENEYSFNWRSKDEGYVNILNPFQGIAVWGSAGAGKSFGCIEPIIETMITKNYTGLVYDFKAPTLTKYVLDSFVHFGSVPAKKDADGKWTEPQSLAADRRKMWVVDFNDILRSHRVNPIHPDYMVSSSFANELALSVFKNLEPESIEKKDFFMKSGTAYLKAIFWFLREEAPEICTLPHAIAISLMDYEKVLAMLKTNEDCTGMIASIAVADKKNAEGQLAGVIASLQVPIDGLNSPEIAWVLSGNDFNLNLNDPENPGILCLGNNPQLKDTYGPVASLVATTVMKLVNTPGRQQFAFLLDEGPTFFIPNLHILPSTGRSNLIATIFCGQDLSQLDGLYGEKEARMLLANLSNVMAGTTGDPKSAERMVQMIGKRQKEKLSISSGKNIGDSFSMNKGDNLTTEKDDLITVDELMNLETGRVVGKVTRGFKSEDHTQFNILTEVDKFKGDYAYDPFLHSSDGEIVKKEQIHKILSDNRRKIASEAKQLVDMCAMAAIVAGISEEAKLFPEHFQKDGDKLNRIKTLFGEDFIDKKQA